MSRPESRARSFFRVLRSSWDLLKLELKVVSGGRTVVLGAVMLAYFAIIAVWAHLADDGWRTSAFFNSSVLLPTFVVAVVLSMGAIIGERDARQLEVSFVSPSGRYRLWVFRLVSILLLVVAAAGVLSGLTWLVIDRDHLVGTTWLHAIPPLLATVSTTAFLSVLFKGASSAGLVVAVVAGFSGFLHLGGQPMTFDLWFNPFLIGNVTDEAAWFRTMVNNRTVLLVVSGLATTFLLGLLQKRERLT
ncbi:MAG: hypothetical protein AAF533_04775 [Acidobacteriota bacterium]